MHLGERRKILKLCYDSQQELDRLLHGRRGRRAISVPDWARTMHGSGLVSTGGCGPRQICRTINTRGVGSHLGMPRTRGIRHGIRHRAVRVLNAEVPSVRHLVIGDLDHGEYDSIITVLLNASACDLQSGM